jgi:hypothetical protein
MTQDELDKVVKSQISRVVALLVPILLPVLGAVSIWLQAKLGVDMNPATATGFVVAVVGGAAWIAWKWLEGRAKFEQKVLELYSWLHPVPGTPVVTPDPEDRV